MFNIDKYRMYDYLQIKGFFADVSTENENGEFIDQFSKDAAWIKSKPVTFDASLTIYGKARKPIYSTSKRLFRFFAESK
jgi:hypothetical protein